MAKQKQVDDTKAIEYIAAALLIGASAQATAKSLDPMVGVPAATLAPVLLLALSKRLTPPSATTTSAVRLSDEEEATYRAGYVWAAVNRVLAGGTMVDEKDNFNRHLEAGRNRHQRASDVDRAAKRFGPRLGWHAKMDAQTSEECRLANGRNFDVSRVPAIGYPGTVHPFCRCKPGRPFNTTATVYDIKPHRSAA